MPDPYQSFTTYKNYLLGLSYLLDSTYPRYLDLSSKLKTVQLRPTVDLDKVRSLLFNSWNSELLLNLPSLFNQDFLKFSNHWSPVQSYYSVYLATRALIVAKNINAQGDHTRTLNIFEANFIRGEGLFPELFGVLSDTGGFRNLPQSITPQRINPLENPYHFRNNPALLWNSYCLFLKTTRDRILNERCSEWKLRNPTTRGPRKRLPPGKRAQLDQRLRGISLLDGLYRLRIRSNYKDVDIFILGSTQPETKYYFDALCNINNKILFLLESYIYRYIGKTKMDSIVQMYENNYDNYFQNNIRYSPINRQQYYN